LAEVAGIHHFRLALQKQIINTMGQGPHWNEDIFILFFSNSWPNIKFTKKTDHTKFSNGTVHMERNIAGEICIKGSIWLQ
jgi:hypothetical protein